LTRIYFPGTVAAHGECELAPDEAHYVTRVLRLREGDPLTLFDGCGGEYAGEITLMARGAVRLKVSARVAVDRESPLDIGLAQGISSGERMDYTVQKAVELGIARIQPLAMARSVVHLDGARAAKRAAHWQAVAVAACAQCGRNRVPEVAPVLPYTTWLARLPAGEGVRLILDPRAARRVRDIERPQGAAWLLCGPEGGFAPVEREDAERAQFLGVKLGPRVLRTETAAVAALAALQALWGDF
jgi:16S rRNA (uracil1498-N3)-methyltransferase